MRKFLIIFIVAGFTFSCEKSNTFPKYQNMDVTSGFVLNNAIILSQGDCAGDELTHTYVCFVSVPADSRCPEEAECIWMGNGVVIVRKPDVIVILSELKKIADECNLEISEVRLRENTLEDVFIHLTGRTLRQ